MKKILASLLLAFLFATGTAWAGSGSSYGDGSDSGCNHYDKWKDT